MMRLGTFDPRRLVGTLCTHGVELILIGGFACEVHGVGNSTGDIDIIIEASESNAQALVAALNAMDGRHAVLPGSKQLIRPSVERVMSLTGFHHYDTSYGRLDVSKESGGFTYQSMKAAGVLHASFDGHDVQLAGLRTILTMKAAAGREKDKAMLPAIERRLAEIDENGS